MQMTDEKYTLYQGDCLEKMQLIQDKSVDLVLDNCMDLVVLELLA